MPEILQFPFQQFLKKKRKKKLKKISSRSRFHQTKKGHHEHYLLPTHILGPNPKGK